MGDPTTLHLDNHSTDPFGDDTMRKIAGSYPGMAHFAGTGPEGETCRGCEFFKMEGYYAENGNKKGDLKPGRCQKYKTLMSEYGPAIPHHARACRHFVKTNDMPALNAKDAKTVSA